MGVKWEPGMDLGRQGFQPETQSANPRLPDGSVPVSGVVPPPVLHVDLNQVWDGGLEEAARIVETMAFLKGPKSSVQEFADQIRASIVAAIRARKNRFPPGGVPVVSEAEVEEAYRADCGNREPSS